MHDHLINELRARFDLQLSYPEGAKHSFLAAELVKEENMREFIDCYSPLMKALDDTAAAAYFANWFSNVALALQYSISAFDTVPDLRLANLVIHLIPDGGYCRVMYSLQQWKTFDTAASGLERGKWRYNTLADFYQNTASPLIQCLSAVSGLNTGQIWGQLPTKFNYYLENLTAEMNNSTTVKILQEDYICLKNELSPEIFGLSKNPFRVNVLLIEDIADPKRTVQMRNRCCLFYRTEGRRYCYTCPRLKEVERAARRDDYREKAVIKSN
ncbi:(2Fe-2S)-binding protein [Paenibacillus sp. BR2-3]|uniref:(2Fe-2S)-binding protein n=1 Tax=Paenibacillus sp. BR2-3 TaxID=3048494 RepID=UPI003977BF35